MAITVYKTFAAGEVLTASDLNASLTQITNNGTDVAFPLTKNSSLGGFSLFFDAANTRSITDAAKGQNLVLTAINNAKTTVASATTPDIWTSTGGLIDYTGTTTATGFAAASQAGAQRTLLCAAAAPFTASANMLIDGYASGSTFTATAGDTVDVIAVTTTQFRLKPRLYSGNAIIAAIALCDFRLTLTTGTAVTTADVTAVATIYFSPYKGNRIALYDGTNWNVRTSAEMSIAVPAVASKMHDVFCYDNAGVPTLEVLAWTNDTTRATALTLQNGVLVKTGVTTRRYVGSFRTTAANLASDAMANRWLWNYYNRVLRPMRVLETTDTWVYTTATVRQANGSAANQLDFVIGYSEDSVQAEIRAGCLSSATYIAVAVGLDTTSAFTSGGLIGASSELADGAVWLTASWKGFPGVGRHVLSWNEYSAAVGTSTWRGDGGSPTLEQSGIHGELWA